MTNNDKGKVLVWKGINGKLISGKYEIISYNKNKLSANSTKRTKRIALERPLDGTY